MRKNILLILLIFCQLSVFSQNDDKTVTLIVSGQGQTQDVAKQSALRNAIEQAFGVFISSKTEILNDELIKDEIVSISNGNIKSFEIVSETKLPSNEYVVSMNVTVSVEKLISFAESKGVVAEFKGSLFAFNIKQQIFNEESEISAISNLCDVIGKLTISSLDFTLKTKNPLAKNSDWIIPIEIKVFANENFESLTDYFFKTLRAISLTDKEVKSYKDLGKPVYTINWKTSKNKSKQIYLRKASSFKKIERQIYYFADVMVNTKINDGFKSRSIKGFFQLHKEALGGSPYSSNYNRLIKEYIYYPISKESDGKKFAMTDNFRPFGNDNKENLFSTPYGYAMAFSLDINSNNFSWRGDISLSLIKKNEPLVEFIFGDVKSLSEIEKLKKYEIVNY